MNLVALRLVTHMGGQISSPIRIYACALHGLWPKVVPSVEDWFVSLCASWS